MSEGAYKRRGLYPRGLTNGTEKGFETSYNGVDQNTFCERFEPSSHFISRVGVIVGVNVVLNRTVVVDSDYPPPPGI